MRAAGLAAISAALVAPPAMAAKSTTLLKQISAATNDGVSQAGIATAGGHTYFSASPSNDGSERTQWIVTGNGAGAAPLTTNPAARNENPASSWTALGDRTYYALSGQLWVTDGTDAGTTRVTAAGSNVRNLTAFGADLYFSGDDYSNAKKLTPSTGVVEPVVLDGDSPELYVEQYAQLPGVLLSSTFDFNLPNNQRRLVAGTEAGSHILTSGGQPLILVGESGEVTVVGSRAYFTAKAGAGGPSRLYSTDGTDVGTHEILDGGSSIAPAAYTPFVATTGGHAVFLAGGHIYETDGETATSVGDGPSDNQWRSPVYAGGKLYFGASAGDDNGLWVLDLAAHATTPVLTRTAYVEQLVESDGVVYAALYAHDQTVLVRTDGTSAGTETIADPTTFSAFAELTPRPGGGIYFSAMSEDYGRELFALTGVPGQAPTLVVDANTEQAGAQFDDDSRHTARFAGKTLFFAAPGLRYHDPQPWITDGTTAGTHRLDAATTFGDAEVAVAFGNRAAFETDGDGYDIYVTDGTADGTHALATASGTRGSNASGPTPVGSSIYYTAQTDTGGNAYGIFKSDGNGPGTMITPPAGWPENVSIGSLKAVGTDLYYDLYDRDDSQVRQLWHLDTASGTSTKLADEFSDFGLYNAVAAGGKLYFPVGQNFGDYENQVWVSDGTVAGTHDLGLEPGQRPNNGAQTRLASDGTVVYASVGVSGSSDYSSHLTRITSGGIERLSDEASAQASNFLYRPAMIDGALYMAYDNALYKLGATATSPTRIKDAPNLSSPVAIDGKLYFAASDDEHGYEPWVSDGTASGTGMLDDVVPGAYSSEPSAFFAAGSRIAFGADNASLGYQLFSFGETPVEPVATTPEPTTPEPTTPATKDETGTPAPPTPPVTPPAPAPVDTRPQVNKVAAKVADVTETKKAYAVDLSGTVRGATGLRTREECTGRVEILVTATTKKGKGKAAKTTVKVLTTKHATLKWSKGKCTYDKTITIKKKDIPAGAKVEATVTYLGSKTQRPKTADPVEIDLD